jgi:hypothetical protein
VSAPKFGQSKEKPPRIGKRTQRNQETNFENPIPISCPSEPTCEPVEMKAPVNEFICKSCDYPPQLVGHKEPMSDFCLAACLPEWPPKLPQPGPNLFDNQQPLPCLFEPVQVEEELAIDKIVSHPNLLEIMQHVRQRPSSSYSNRCKIRRPMTANQRPV